MASTNDDLCFTPATELARMFAGRTVSPVEVMDAVLARLEALNPRLNAICTPTADSAMSAARRSEKEMMSGAPLGPLHGVPTTIKDLVFTRGVRTASGTHVYADRVPDVDAPVVTRLREAGAISIGKTAVPELGWKGCGDSPLTGTSHNPWMHGMNAGGSSTGAAICAASGIGPIHQGSDGAGSIRIPAAFCGIYGIKPSFGRVPNFPVPNNDSISHVGPMTRTVADAALVLGVIAGPDPRDPYTLEASPADYLARLDEDLSGRKVAWSPDLGYLPVDDDVARVAREAVSAFERLGCHVEEVDPGWGDQREMELFFYSANFAGMVGPFLEEWGAKMDPGLVACARDGMTHSAAAYVRMRQRRLDYYETARTFFDDYDLLLTPSLSVAAFPVNTLIPSHWEQHPWDWIRWAGFSYPFNLLGLPAATCPCGFTPDGLPIGLQIVGGRFQDLGVLQASCAFEQARPWSQARPPL